MDEKTYNEMRDVYGYMQTDTFKKHVCDILDTEIKETANLLAYHSWEAVTRAQGKLEGLKMVEKVFNNVETYITDFERSREG